MGRGLDGCFYPGLVQFPSSTEAVSKNFRWCIARGRHLFPFRTEQLSPSAPMVLGGQPPGRVGRRRFFLQGPPVGRSFFCAARRQVSRRDEELAWTSLRCRGIAFGRPDQRLGAKRSIAAAQAPVLRRLPMRRRPSHGEVGRSTGSSPYSPRVAKSIKRSAASTIRSVIGVFVVSNISSNVRWSPDGTRKLHSFLQSVHKMPAIKRVSALPWVSRTRDCAAPRRKDSASSAASSPAADRASRPSCAAGIRTPADMACC
jgi:hypothetical protein